MCYLMDIHTCVFNLIFLGFYFFSLRNLYDKWLMFFDQVNLIHNGGMVDMYILSWFLLLLLLLDIFIFIFCFCKLVISSFLKRSKQRFDRYWIRIKISKIELPLVIVKNGLFDKKMHGLLSFLIKVFFPYWLA